MHVPALDGIRGAAILLVIIYHFSSSLSVLGFTSPVFRLLQFGWCGVDVFFVLSGFLITGILLDTKSSPAYFRNFYARRVLRIFPLYFGSILVVFLLRLALPGAGVWGSLDGPLPAGSLLWPALYLQNIAIFLYGSSVTGVTTHYWSLAVEEHFYLIWPLVVWLGTRRQIMIIAFAAALLSIAGRVLLAMRGADLDPVFGLTPLRMDGLAIGAMASVLIRGNARPSEIARLARMVFAGAGLLLVALLVLRHTPRQEDLALWIFAYPLVAVVTAAGLLVAMAGGPIASLLSLPPLRWLGKYSFGLYVWHPIIGMLLLHSQVAMVFETSGKSAILVAALAALVADLSVAWLSYHLWEIRFLDLKRYFSARAPRPPASAPVSHVEPDRTLAAVLPAMKRRLPGANA